MSAQTIDYDALAQKHGAVSAPVDYDALATKHGASLEAPSATATPAAPTTYNDYKDKYGSTGTGVVILPQGVKPPAATPENQQQFQQEQVNQAATAGQMMLGGGGIKTVANAAEAAAPVAKPILKGGWKILDAASFDRVGKIFDAIKTMGEEVGEAINPAKFPGATLPEAPSAELLQARNLAQGGQAASEPAAALGKLAAPIAPAAAVADTAAPIAQGVKNIPPTLRGDSALRQVLTGQDNANLTKIARSRGINIAQESQLKPGFADNRLINKIITDFSPEELQEVESQFMENTRFRHAFGDIGPEAWKTMSLKTYFPEVKISAAQIGRTQKAIANIKAAAAQAQSASEDLTPEWEAALKQIQASKAGQ